MIFNNWKYLRDKQGPRIVPDSDKPLPNSFIKYYSLSNNSVNAFTNRYLFFSHPSILNDPFDSCRQMVCLDKFSERQFVKLHERNQRLITPDMRYSHEHIQSRTSRLFREDKSDLEDSYLTFFWNLIFKDWGILSLAGVDNDMLMWSYYNNHQGFALEFENQLFEDNGIIGPFPINYADHYETISPRSIRLETEQLLYVTNVKYSQWSHEKEWRFLVNRENMSIPNYNDPTLELDKRKVSYKKDKVKSIILGYKFFAENMTKTYFGKGKRLYQFNPVSNEMDKLKIEIINYIIENNITVREVEIVENNTFSLNVMNIELICKQKGHEYYVVSEYYKKPSS
ncbi:DUF2971 domain-containing protein [Carboxylicivirga marina]|uniref:DUF2971 domain-containing protein n=1 Tax=Carboxylicivirga marina TaxID=2800988 RepID=A0ABS1HQM7_9BACT|nr:DUF2971 domain-containing protein [Carboxylicivirga marina]MBK3519974.1 DUF2971 domain-containing protein [Carboxylicivirga marina]